MSEALGSSIESRTSRLSWTLLYMRVAALLLLIAGLARACQILGIFTPDGLGFAELAPARQSAAVTLLIADLFAAVGLWIAAAWGPVMWAVALAVEVSMYTLFSDLFGSYPLRLLVHGAVFGGFLALSVFEWRRTSAD